MPSGAQALKEVQIIRFSHLKHGSLTSSRWAMPIIYKGLVHPEDTKAGHTEIFSILQQKNMEGCTQLIPEQSQVS